MRHQAFGVFYALEPAMHLNKSRVEQRHIGLIFGRRWGDVELWKMTCQRKEEEREVCKKTSVGVLAERVR